MKLDKNGIIITSRQILKNSYCAVKENTAQIAIAIPIMGAILTVLVNFCHFLTVYGYYCYFEIDKRLILPYNSVNLYQMLSLIVIVGAYWVFAIFAVRMFFNKKNILGKIVCWIVVPIVINWLMCKEIYSELKISLLLALILIQWLLIWAMGYCFVPSFHDDIRETKRKKLDSGINKSDKVLNRRKDNIILGILLIFIALIFEFWEIYEYNNDMAREQKYYGIIDFEGKEYAVIDGNIDKLVLQECLCDNNKKELTIYTNTYIYINNNTEIMYNNFEEVKKGIK